MTDFAFDNYCINCEKLCDGNSIYCSDVCKKVDESNSKQFVNNQEEVPDTSPLLAPYAHESQDHAIPPLDYSNTYTYDNHTSGIDLNYSLYNTSNATSDGKFSLSSASHNYRKWLTGCI